ncbi:hypothetical protein LTR95_013064 [Oleoguttula sp. CCFEE 5521]
MADPLSVISAIASVIQLVDFSAKLLSRLNEYRSKGNELPASFTHIDRQLPLLREILGRSKVGIESKSISDREVKAIAPCLEGCGQQIEKLKNILDKIVSELQENVVKRLAKGLRSVWKESEVRDIDDHICGYVKTLSFYCAWSSSKLDSRNDTGNWYLHGDQYQNWKTGERPFTWLYGAAGSGKSILSAGICHDLQGNCDNDPATSLALWFFDFNDNAKQDPSNMLRSLIPNTLQSLHAACEQAGRSACDDDLLLVLKDVLNTILTSFLVLDALDECTSRPPLFEIIEEMRRWNIAGARILMTSREEVDVQEALEDVVPKTARTYLESHLVDKDIQTYVHEKLTKDKAFRRWQSPMERRIREEIETILAQKANGMLVLPSPCFPASRSAGLAANWTFWLNARQWAKFGEHSRNYQRPCTSETYDRIVRTIADGVNSQEAIKLLTWLAYSDRPLEIGELLEVTGICLDDEPRFDRDEVLTDPRDVLRICSSLVSMTTIIDGESVEYHNTDESSVEHSYARDVDCGFEHENSLGVEISGHSAYNGHATGNNEDSTSTGQILKLEAIAWRRQHVRLAHFSVREYLTSDRLCIPKYRLRMVASHDMLASTCLVCLLQNYSLQHYDVSAKVRSWGARLFRYAADSWGIHAKASGEFSELQNELVHELLVMDFSALEATIEAMSHRLPYDGLHLASFFGLSRAATRLLEDPSINVDASHAGYGTALHVASDGNHPEIVRILLDRGANVNSRCGYPDRTALYVAAELNFPEIAVILLDRGADSNATVESYGSALRTASRLGHYKVVEHLVNHGADVHLPSVIDSEVSLLAASRSGFAETVRVLLDHGADVESPNGFGDTALLVASHEGHLSVMKVLLARGADVNQFDRGQFHGNALLAAFQDNQRRRDEVVELLLYYGADPDVHRRFWIYTSRGRCYHQNPLQAAVGEGYEAIAQMLRDKNAKSWPCCRASLNGGVFCEDETNRAVIV